MSSYNHQSKQLKSNHQDQQRGNKKEVSKTNQENESLLTVPRERPYKETLITQKKNNLWREHTKGNQFVAFKQKID